MRRRSANPGGAPILVLRVLGRLALLLAVFFAAGVLGYRAYLATPPLPAVPPLPAQHPALARRVVLFVIDAFTPRSAFDPAVMPTVARLAREGASGIVQTGPVTTTAPCIAGLMTGRPGTLVQAIFNFDAAETRADSLLTLAVAAGGRVALSGDPSWSRQFGWLVPPADRHEEAEPGISTDPRIDEADARSVDFLLRKIADPAYTVLVVHVGSVDAVGHMVTPLVARYREQLRFADGLVARVARAVDLRTTVLLVTGDHGMAARGTHGGEEEARLTPYLLVGPGVRRGAVADVPQTALTATLSALLGLPFLPVSEYPPRTDLLGVPAGAAERLRAEYLEGKLRAAEQAGRLPPPDDDRNVQLNGLLFQADDARSTARLAAATAGLLGILLAAWLARRSSPHPVGHPSALGHLAWAAAAPLAIAAVATAFMSIRGLVPLTSITLAAWIMGALVVACIAAALVLLRWPRLDATLRPRQLSLLFPALVVLSAPLVNSHWLNARPYFASLLVCAVAGVALARRSNVALVRPSDVPRPAFRAALPVTLAAAILLTPRLPGGSAQAEPALVVLAVAVAAAAAWRLRGGTDEATRIGTVLLAAIFALAWAWRLRGGRETAAGVLGLFALGLVWAFVHRDAAARAGAMIVGISAALFLIMASDAREAIVFQAAALGALALTRFRLDLSRPDRVLVVAVLALVVRTCLYFELGDRYDLNSIRTAPGFLLAAEGVPLASVIGLLLLKYSLPWFLILGAGFPSLAAAGPRVALHVVDLLVLGYVARLAAVVGVVDALRILPNGMNGIVGTFCTTWAEFVTFAVAATVAIALVAPKPERHEAAALAAA